MIRLLFYIVKTVLLILLPFIFLVRGSVYFYAQEGFSSWMAVAFAAFITFCLLTIYIVFFWGRLTGQVGSLRLKVVIAVFLVVLFSGQALLFLSEKNVKKSSIRKEFTSLHPILRLSISTIIYIDPDLIITDANRLPEDYRKMGLPSKKQSLHYRQSTGYVHAFDIRTKNRSWLRNRLLQFYFFSMGFNTLRHGGTADHLHISLTSPDRPGAI